MRFIGLIVVALALVSMSHQSQMSFGEFVGGHNLEDSRVLKVTRSSDDKFNKLMPNQKLVVRVVSGGKVLIFDGPNNMCVKSNAQAKPNCSQTPSFDHEIYLLKFAYEVIFSKSTTIADFWAAPKTGTFRYTAGSKWLEFTPAK